MKKPTLHFCTKIQNIPEFIPSGKRVIALIDSNLKDTVSHILHCPIITFDSYESNKNLATIENLAIELMKCGADRESFLLVVGGGILGDIGGFLASIYHRGIKWGLIPTTLLSQVDSSIGGKTGVNVENYKNILGTFNLPDFTVYCGEFLDTIGKKEIKDGLSEMLKTFLIADKTAYLNTVDLLTGENPYQKKISLNSQLQPLIKKAAQIKTEITNTDPNEKGIRKLLNFGHTFGHAIEKASGLSHGEGVSIGMVIALNISAKLNLIPKSETKKVINDFKKLSLTYTSPIPVVDLIEIIEKDKKRVGDKIDLILLERIGEAVIYPLKIERLKAIINDLS